MTVGSPDRDAARRHEEAVAEGQYANALTILTTDLSTQLIALLRARGYEIEFFRPPTNSDEFFGGIASAIDEHRKEAGDEAPYFLAVCLELASSLLGLQSLLQTDRSKDPVGPNDLAQLLLQAMTLGSRAEYLGLVLSGHFDEFLNLKLDNDLIRQRRQAGAAMANEKRRGPRKMALDDALKRCEANPRLSNEDLAVKAKSALNLPTSIRTITEWMRESRRKGDLPPIKT